MMKGVRYMMGGQAVVCMGGHSDCRCNGRHRWSVCVCVYVRVCACVCGCVDVCGKQLNCSSPGSSYTCDNQPDPSAPYEMNGRGTGECVRAPQVRGWLHSDSIEFRQRKSDTSKKQECVAISQVC